MKNWNEERYFTFTVMEDTFNFYATTLEVNKALHDINHMERPVTLIDVLKAFTELDDDLSGMIDIVEATVILPDNRFYLNVSEELSEEEHEWIPSIIVCYNESLY